MSDVQSYFDKQEGQVQAIALCLHDLLNTEIPDAEVKLAWNFPCWLSNGIRVASLAAYKDRCNLQLWQGAELADRFPRRIEGTGKDLRHVKVRSLAEIDEELRLIVRAALNLEPRQIR